MELLTKKSHQKVGQIKSMRHNNNCQKKFFNKYDDFLFLICDVIYNKPQTQRKDDVYVNFYADDF